MSFNVFITCRECGKDSNVEFTPTITCPHCGTKNDFILEGQETPEWNLKHGIASHIEKEFGCSYWCESDCEGHLCSIKHHSTSNTYTINLDGQEVYTGTEGLQALIKCLQEIQK